MSAENQVTVTWFSVKHKMCLCTVGAGRPAAYSCGPAEPKVRRSCLKGSRCHALCPSAICHGPMPVPGVTGECES